MLFYLVVQRWGAHAVHTHQATPFRKPESGFTLAEMLTVMMLAAIISGIALVNFRDFDNPLENGAAQLSSFIKQVRAEAIRSTSAYIITPTSTSRLETSFAATCTTPDPEPDTRITLDLPEGASLVDTNWDFCFNSRGLPDANIEILLSDVGGANRTVEVLLGGSVRVQ
jgi:prepilin-type N-terminal cleavage/methylation domain-containing protein